MADRLDAHKIGMKISEAFVVAHFLVANALILLGETTNLIEQGLQVYGKHPGVIFVLETLDAPFYPLFSAAIAGTPDSVVYYLLVELVILVASFAYAAICYCIVRFIISAFRPDLKR